MGLHHLLTGSYTNTSLFLLAFDTAARTLSLNGTVPGFGLHQYVTSNAARDRIYATTMSEPPRIFSWAVSEDFMFTHLDTVNVNDGKYTFSAGGPGARINLIAEDGGIGEQIDEMFYVPKQDIEDVDKTRQAVLYGAHAFDVNVNRKGGWDAIFMYDIGEEGKADLLSINLTPSPGDGPRNSYPTADGKLLYVINEHSQYLDVYEVGITRLEHSQRATVIPEELRGKYTYRSNTVEKSRDGKYLFTSTRGWNNTEANGWVAAHQLNKTGYLATEEPVAFFKAPLTLGSAAGLRVAFWEDETNSAPGGVTDYMYLSDTSEGCMFILGWAPQNHTLEQVAEYCYPGGDSPYEAVWLD
ncbi:carboxy-cis,cis-muconate cyclase [Colletotrichum plurivorum]|uniref:Carboxy-cis,cis-muconate cyclase n=1 Tax=Colletotrichum plurivorum TaxID=2175906 RepID=A0A8H6JH35_9PEZI|nr:carboxy-cis,cis-muconate cyclase [Colletotrichum plurivorum]